MPTPADNDASFMALWERGSPMRSFIYYLQRGTCGALAYLVLHQTALGLRLMAIQGTLSHAVEALLSAASLPGHLFCVQFLHPTRPFGMPVALATFFLNIMFYFAAVWLTCFALNAARRQTFVGPKGDPFVLTPKESDHSL